LSKALVGAATQVGGFLETLSTVDPATVQKVKKRGSDRLKAGIQAVLEKARQEGLELGRAEGHAEGYAVGQAEGRTAFEASHAEELASLRRALEEFVAGLDAWYAEAEESLADLALQIAREALADELQTSRDSVLAIAKRAVAEVRHGSSVRLRANPLDCPTLEANRDDVIQAAKGVRKLEVVPDFRILAGCEVESDGGVVDARVESFLDRLEDEAA
jgi:flagellar biosynthesis/type III secretory pathway protein FliH